MGSYLIYGGGKSGQALFKSLNTTKDKAYLYDDNPMVENCISQKECIELLHSIDCLIISPGVPRCANLVKHCQAQSIPVYGEVEFCVKFCNARIIAITGTNGKTTVASLLHHILTSSGVDCYLLGNIGVPLSSMYKALKSTDLVVLEVSSFQLERFNDFNPYISVLLNVKPEHIDRHGSVEEYVRCKSNVLINQTSNHYTVINNDDDTIVDIASLSKAKKYYYGESTESSAWYSKRDKCIYYYDSNSNLNFISILNKYYTHNIKNIECCVAVAGIFGIQPSMVEKAITSYSFPPHRMSSVMTINGVEFINDSKSTNCASTLSAVSNFDKCCLILGGSDKGSSYQELIEVMHKCEHVACYGATGQLLYELLCNHCKSISLHCCLSNAVESCYEVAKAKKCPVLFSPACASFDFYTDYAHRGDCFVKIVGSITSKVQTN